MNQTPESTMNLIIRNSKIVRQTNAKTDFIENADKKPKDINKWISDVSSVQRQAPSVVYSKAFPDIESLMQVNSNRYGAGDLPIFYRFGQQKLKMHYKDLDFPQRI